MRTHNNNNALNAEKMSEHENKAKLIDFEEKAHLFGNVDSGCQKCQSAESEVKFLKEWLILHLDLIQQQNDEILGKERRIIVLQQENEMLKERLSCLEKGTEFHPKRFFGLTMTQDSGQCEEDKKNGVNVVRENGVQKRHSLSDCESQNSIKSDFNSSFNLSVSDSMPNSRKKRLSNASAVSNNDSIEEKRSFRKLKKRRKRVIKDSQIITTTEHYITETCNTNLRLGHVTEEKEIPISTNLEVPRWRIKVYASCYAMEGTENLDDEVFNKRHSRLENDERRRKRWDVQRIREQRIVEKLKQRQERVGSGSRIDDQNDPMHSLFPLPEEVKFLEVTEELPVVAFGFPIPSISPSEFELPWLNNPSLLVKKVPVKKKRRSTKR